MTYTKLEIGKRYLIAKFSNLYEAVVLELASEHVKFQFIKENGSDYSEWSRIDDYHIKEALPVIDIALFKQLNGMT